MIFDMDISYLYFDPECKKLSRTSVQTWKHFDNMQR